MTNRQKSTHAYCFLPVIIIMLVTLGCSLGERFNEYDPYSPEFSVVPGGLKASDGLYVNKVRLDWNELKSADKFYIYRQDNSGDAYVKIGESSNYWYDDDSPALLADRQYSYKIKAYLISETLTGFSGADTGYRRRSTLEAPVIEGITEGLYNTGQSFTISGMEGTTLEYSLDNGTTWLTYTSTVSIDTSGNYTIIARQKDTYGTVSELTSAIILTIDLTLTDVTTLPAPIIADLTTGLYNTPRTFTITGSSYLIIEYSLNNGTTWNTYTGEVTINESGIYLIITRQKDTFGHISGTSAVLSITIDTSLFDTEVLPVPVITGISDGFYNTERTFSISGNDFTTKEYSLDNGTTWHTYAGNVTLSEAGIYYIIARQKDDYEHVSGTSSLITLTIDTSVGDTGTLPVPVIGGITTGTFNTPQTFTVDGYQFAQVEYSVDNGSTWESYTTAVTLTDDDVYQVTARQRDAYGHVSNTATVITVTIDTLAGAVVLAGTPEPVTNSTTLTIDVSGDDITAYRYKIDTGSWSTDQLMSDPIEESGLSAGDHTIYVIGKDSAGNWQAEGEATSFSWTIDLAAPDDAGSFTATATSSVAIDLTWTNPGTDFSGVLILQQKASAITSAPTDGASYSAGTPLGGATVLYTGTLTAFSHTDLSADTTYYYKIFTYDGALNYSGGVAANATTLQPIIYVSTTTGNDSNDGLTGDTPLQTIQAGINKALALFGTADVYVAAGTYTGDILLKNNISVYGGYNAADWNDRNNIDRTNPTYQTIVNAASARAFYDDYNSIITNTSVTIDGFTITGGSEYNSDGIRLMYGSSPVISNNTINGGTGTNAIAVNSNSGSPTIEDNIITGGTGSNTYGIYSYSATIMIRDNTIDGGSGSLSYGISAQYSNNTITNNVINGGTASLTYGLGIDTECNATISFNTISGGTGSQTHGVYISDAVVTVNDNTIDGGDSTLFSYGVYTYSDAGALIKHNSIIGTNGTNSYGIYNYSNSAGSIEMIGNTIYGGTGSTDSTGIYNDGTICMIINNVVHGGAGTTTYGIYNDDSSPNMYNNTINGGSGTTAYGIYAYWNALSEIKNNTIFTTGSGTRYGIYEDYSASTNPTALQNNNIFDCILYYDADVTGDITDIASVNDYNNTTQNASNVSTGNISIDMIDNGGEYYFSDYDGISNDVDDISDNDWRVTAGAPVNIRAGGLLLSSDVTDDRNAVTRTATYDTGGGTPDNTGAGGYTIGAYEKD